jgi:hypothetical protein
MPSDATIQQVWIVSLISYFAVVVVVAGLLTLILRTVRRIHDGAAAIWTVGQKVANNTIHIALLVRTHHIVRRILDSVRRTAAAVDAVGTHAGACPHCPSCVRGAAGSGRAS